jgi:hypothetical protein
MKIQSACILLKRCVASALVCIDLKIIYKIEFMLGPGSDEIHTAYAKQNRSSFIKT